MNNIYDSIIIGAGPAGLTAGLYCSRAKLSTIVLEMGTPGGQMINIETVENYSGFESITGPDLASNMMTQATSFGLELGMAEVQTVNLGKDFHTVHTSMGDYFGKTIIVASGSHHRKLGVPGEEEFFHKGVFYCAICDGSPYADKVVAVAGGGDAGITEALYLSRIASKVIVLESMQACKATSILLDRSLSNPKIEIQCGVRIEKISGDGSVKAIDLCDMKTGAKSQMAVDGVLVHIGLAPNTDCVKSILSLNTQKQIPVDDRLQTEIPGIFAAGDVRSSSACQITTAVGDGATASLSAQRYLNGLVNN